MTVRLAILDIGATLVTGPPRGPASRIAERLGLDGAQKARLQAALMTSPFTAADEVAACVTALGAGRPRRDVERVVTDVWEAQHAEAQPIDGAAGALETLRASGLRLAVISNIWEPYLAAARTHLGPFLDAHVAPELQLYSCRQGHAKPSPHSFLRALEVAGVEPGEAVMIGDSYGEDMEPAISLGLGTVWVLHRPEQEKPGLLRILGGEAAVPARVVPAIGAVTAATVAAAGPRHAPSHVL